MDIYNVALRCVVETTLPLYIHTSCLMPVGNRIFPHKPSSFFLIFSFTVVTNNYYFHPSICSVHSRSSISQCQQHLLCLITVRKQKLFTTCWRSVDWLCESCCNYGTLLHLSVNYKWNTVIVKKCNILSTE
jgi:hypothetical protein